MSVIKYLYGEEQAEQFLPRRRFTLGQSPPKIAEQGKPTVNSIAKWANKYYKKMDTPYSIGISPNDKLLGKLEETEISKQIAGVIAYLWDQKLITGFIMVGEYCPKYRFHYHGFIAFKQGKAMSIAKRLLSLEGMARVVMTKVNNINEMTIYYLFKTYMKVDVQVRSKNGHIRDLSKSKNGTQLDGRNVITTFKEQDKNTVELF